MNQEMIEALLNWLMWISLGALLLIAAACAYVGLRRLGKALCVRLSPVAIGVFAVAAIVATGEAQKRLLRVGPLGERALPECGALGDRALPNVTAEEIAQGWRPESVVTNDAVSYAMPTNGVEYMPPPEHDDCEVVTNCVFDASRGEWSATMATATPRRGLAMRSRDR